MLTFTWLDKLISYGWSHTINDDDVYPLPDYDQASINVRDFEHNESKNRSLFFNILWNFRYEFTLMTILSFIWSMTMYISPLALQQIIGYIENPTNYAVSPYVLVTGLLIGPVIETIVYQYVLWVSTKVMIRMRSVLTAELYAKLLVTREQGSADPSDEEAKSRVGRITNLIQTDISTLTDLLELIIYLVTSPLRLGLCIWFLYNLLGWSSIAGLAMVIITLPLPTIVTKQFGVLQERVMNATDKRLGLVTELLSSIRVVKYFAWEEAMKARVGVARENEIQEIKARNVNYIYMGLIWGLIPLLIMLTTFLVYTKIMGEQLTASVAFTALSLFNLLRLVIGQLPWCIGTLMRARVSYDRIVKFLDEPEIEKPPKDEADSSHLHPAASFHNATFKWFDMITTADASKKATVDDSKQAITKDSKQAVTTTTTTTSASTPEVPSTTPEVPSTTPEVLSSTPEVPSSGAATPQRQFMLRDLNLAFPRGELSLVSGPTGCGKTSLLMALLGEMCTVSGTAILDHTSGVAYVAQTAWLQNDTIRNNILFGEKYDEERYKKVLYQCALDPDLAVLDAGDETEVGEKGITLSGGQKQRISLARAVYSQAHTVLLDDCLSAVDSHTAKHLFTHCLMGDLLKHRTRILVTHYVALTSKGASYIVVLENGRVVGEGPVAEVLRQKSATNVLMEDESTDLKDADKESKEERHTHAASGSASTLTAEHAPSASEATLVADDSKSDETKVAKSGKLIMTEERVEGSVGWPVYKLYLSACGGPWFWAAFFIASAIGHLTGFGQSWWIQVWTRAYSSTTELLFGPAINAFPEFVTDSADLWVSGLGLATTIAPSMAGNGTSNDGTVNVDYYLGIYAAIGLGCTAVSLFTWYLLILGALRASRQLHRRLLNSVCAAPIRWFDRVPVGRITNRFAKDMETIDTEVADNMSNAIDNAVTAIGVLLIVSLVMPFFIIPGTLIALTFVGIGYAYIRTNLALRRLVSVHRSPIYSHFGDSIVGVVTIRAFGVTRRFFEKTLTINDQFNRPQIMMYSVNRWLHIRADSTSGLVAFVAGVLAVAGDMNAGLAGMSLTLAMQFTDSILWLVRNYNLNELNMNSVERVAEYLQIDQEPAPTEHGKPPAAWPTRGDVKVENLTVRYSPDGPAVLKNVSFEVQSRQKVGIVGRTGSGKSTLALTMLRFLDQSEGRILINDVDISSINLPDLRTRITIIPQDPVLFSGTVRTNLDPFDQHDDAMLNDALRQSHLNVDEANLTPEQQGREDERIRITLDSTVSENGSNFSQGQRQLIALARALVRRSKVIIMDEATASVDRDTDDKIQATIRSEFGESTLITIAHRLRTVMDFDRILVLDSGRVAEYDEPYKLIKDDKTIFHSMCKKSGEYDELLNVAKAHHNAIKTQNA